MTARLPAVTALFAVAAAVAVAVVAAAGELVTGPGIRRIENMADGAPAFAVLDARGVVVRRVVCINNHQYDPDALAGHFLDSTAVLERVVAKDGRIGIEDLGPAGFDCIVVTA